MSHLEVCNIIDGFCFQVKLVRKVEVTFPSWTLFDWNFNLFFKPFLGRGWCSDRQDTRRGRDGYDMQLRSLARIEPGTLRLCVMRSNHSATRALWNFNILTTLDFFKAITWAEDWNIYKQKHSCSPLDFREQTATFTAIPLEFYENIEVYTFQFWTTFLY